MDIQEDIEGIARYNGRSHDTTQTIKKLIYNNHTEIILRESDCAQRTQIHAHYIQDRNTNVPSQRVLSAMST